MDVGTVAAAGSGWRLRPPGPVRRPAHYTDRHRLPESLEQELGLTFHANAREMVPHCDVVTINAPLHRRPATCSTISCWPP